MFRSPMSNMNSIQPIGTSKFGSGSSSYSSFFNKFSWKTIIYIVLVVLLILICY